MLNLIPCIVSKYLDEFKFIFENVLSYEIGSKVLSIDVRKKKLRSKISCKCTFKINNCPLIRAAHCGSLMHDLLGGLALDAMPGHVRGVRLLCRSLQQVSFSYTTLFSWRGDFCPIYVSFLYIYIWVWTVMGLVIRITFSFFLVCLAGASLICWCPLLPIVGQVVFLSFYVRLERLPPAGYTSPRGRWCNAAISFSSGAPSGWRGKQTATA